jgi:hypothetical protein
VEGNNGEGIGGRRLLPCAQLGAMRARRSSTTKRQLLNDSLQASGDGLAPTI